MVVAVAKAMEEGAQGHHVRLHRQHQRLRRRLRRAATASPPTSSCPTATSPRGKLAQSVVYGAEIIAIDGNFDDALRLAREITRKHPVALVNSVNPYRIEGQKTAAFEIVDALGDAPDVLVHPRRQRRQHHRLLARLRGIPPARAHAAGGRACCGFQAAGAAPIVLGAPVEDPQTIASAIRIGNPAIWKTRHRRPRRVRRQHRQRHRRRDPRGLPPPRPRRGHLLRARLRRLRRRPAQAAPPRGDLRRQDRASASSPATASRTPRPRSDRAAQSTTCPPTWRRSNARWAGRKRPASGRND